MYVGMRPRTRILVSRAAAGWRWSRSNRFARAVELHPCVDLVRIGSDYGGWVVPASLLGSNAVCYCCGVGDDVSFDRAVMERWGCSVHAFDPTPKAAALARRVAAEEPRYRFLEVGLWSSDSSVPFFAPPGATDPNEVENWSAKRAKGGLRIEARVRSLSSLMKELGHVRLDLLKLDIEGAEYEVLGAVLRDWLDIRVICVEFHKTPSVTPMIEMTQRLQAAGYRAVALDGFDVTFVRSHAS